MCMWGGGADVWIARPPSFRGHFPWWTVGFFLGSKSASLPAGPVKLGKQSQVMFAVSLDWGEPGLRNVCPAFLL